MSGSGSNITKLLELQGTLEARTDGSPFRVCVLVTDTSDPERCNARSIAKRHRDLPVVELDLRAFYRQRGMEKTSLMTPQGFRIREEWTEELWRRLQPHRPDLGAFGGFEPLSNICRHFPCVNVHPGDLSVMRDGKPYLVGLHTIPIKRAILAGLSELRTTTILATPYTERLEMDEGPVLMISEPLKIELPSGVSVQDLEKPGKAEMLENLAKRHQARLKEAGDWKVFPLTIQLVAEGRFGLDEAGRVTFDHQPLDRGLRLPVPSIES